CARRWVESICSRDLFCAGGNQNDRVHISVRQDRAACDFPAVVNVIRVYDFEVRSGEHQGVYVDHGLTLLREKAWPAPYSTDSGITHYLALGIDAVCGAAGPGRRQDSEIVHDAVFPEKRMMSGGRRR